jgi:tripartite-type tricarboxylate transporter receptor subunit TctC
MTMLERGRCAVSTVTLTVLSAALVAAASSERVAAQDFYQGKTVQVIVGNVSSSGYDPYGRVLARHMAKYIPGKPTIIVQNMPGAGSIKATDYTYNVAPKDGTVITLVMPGALMEPLTGDPAKFRYNATKLEYLGTADAGTRLCFTRGSSAVKTFEDAKKTKSIMAATAAGSSLWDYPNFLKSLVGAKFEVVSGYPGPADAILAVERGEADGICGLELSTVRTLRPDWIGGPKTNIFMQIALEPHPELKQLGIPEIWGFIPAEHRPVVDWIVAQQAFQRPFIAPPGTPEPQLKILRAAFMATWKDPEALADAERAKIDVNPKSGEEVAALLKKLYDAPKDLIDKMSAAIRP